MVKIIGGKRYNSETATKLGSYSPMHPGYSDGYIATLYQKKGGEFFLHGMGGAGSPYSVDVPSNPGAKAAGEKIIPLSTKQAMEWAEEYLSSDEYEAIFGEVGEDGEMPGKVQVAFWITEGQKKQAQALDVTHAEIFAAGLTKSWAGSEVFKLKVSLTQEENLFDLEKFAAFLNFFRKVDKLSCRVLP